MKQPIIIILLLATVVGYSQNKSPEEYGFKHLSFTYKADKVDILIKTKTGDENKKKPIFFFCQGSLPQPLIKYDEQGMYGVFPFNPDSLSVKYHLVIVSKPYIPLIADVKILSADYCFVDSNGKFPIQYSQRNLLDYYVNRNIEIIKYLQKLKWISNKRLIVAGHSEGSTIAAKMASVSPLISHLIYSGGNPMGRILSIIQQGRFYETDSTQQAEEEIKYWENVVKNKWSMVASQGDTYKATFDFSYPPINYLKKLNIPVLVCYGTKDWSSPYNDFLRVDVIRSGKKNFTFKSYIGNDHNYFPLNSNHQPNYDVFNWDNVANDWLKWLNVN